METLLKEVLWDYIITHNPELMYDLQEAYTVSTYLDDKIRGVQPMALRMLEDDIPRYLIQARCLETLTEDLKPSRYLYLKGIFEEEFADEAALYADSGILECEVVSMLEYCKDMFDTLGFSVHNEGDPGIRSMVISHLYGFLYAEHQW